jgi:hypothetical protein
MTSPSVRKQPPAIDSRVAGLDLRIAASLAHAQPTLNLVPPPPMTRTRPPLTHAQPHLYVLLVSTPLPAKPEPPLRRPNARRHHSRKFYSMGIAAAATTRPAADLPLWPPAPATVGYGEASSGMRTSDDVAIDFFLFANIPLEYQLCFRI